MFIRSYGLYMAFVLARSTLVFSHHFNLCLHLLGRGLSLGLFLAFVLALSFLAELFLLPQFVNSCVCEEVRKQKED